MKNQAAVELGRLGGSAKSPRKAQTSAENGKKAALGQKFIIRSNFHNTRINIVSEVDTALSESQVKRINRTLCGMSDCMCGGINNCTVEDQDGTRYEMFLDTNGGKKDEYVIMK